MDIDRLGTKVKRTLKKGDTGLSVALWQQFLIERKIMIPLSQDDMEGDSPRYKDDHIIGEFEDLTENATKKYQNANNLEENGILDSKTYAIAAKNGFKGNELEAALLLGFNRVNRTLLFEFEVIFKPRNICFKIGNKELGIDESLKHFKIPYGLA
jgi:Putative peptidoglycan binding domain